jgi:hypothetical protein
MHDFCGDFIEKSRRRWCQDRYHERCFWRWKCNRWRHSLAFHLFAIGPFTRCIKYAARITELSSHNKPLPSFLDRCCCSRCPFEHHTRYRLSTDEASSVALVRIDGKGASPYAAPRHTPKPLLSNTSTNDHSGKPCPVIVFF